MRLRASDSVAPRAMLRDAMHLRASDLVDPARASRDCGRTPCCEAISWIVLACDTSALIASDRFVLSAPASTTRASIRCDRPDPLARFRRRSRYDGDALAMPMAAAPIPRRLTGPALDRSSAIPPAALGVVALRPLGELSLPRPDDQCSGLFPATDVRPPPPARGGLRLRRAVLLTVVVGVAGLMGYVSWQHAAHARTAVQISGSPG